MKLFGNTLEIKRKDLLAYAIGILLMFFLLTFTYTTLMKYDYWPRIKTNFDQFYDADSNYWMDTMEGPFGHFSLLHPYRNLFLFPLGLVSRFFSSDLVVFFISIGGLVLFQTLTIRVFPIFRNLFRESKFLFFVPFFSCSAVIWIFVPESFLIAGTLIYAGVILTSTALNERKVVFYGLLSISLNILGFLPWLFSLIKNHSLTTSKKVLCSSLVVAISALWIFGGKRFYGDAEYLRDSPIKYSAIVPKILESNDKIQFLHSPTLYFWHAVSGYLTGPWTVAFENSNTSEFASPWLLAVAISLNILSLIGLIKGIRDKSQSLSRASQSLLAFDVFMLLVFFSFGKIHDPILFMPLIMPGRLFGLYYFLINCSVRWRRALVGSVFVLTFLTIASDILK